MASDGSGGVSVRAGASPNLAGRRAALRRAQRRALVRTARANADPERATFACALVCVACGQLRWPDRAEHGAPHRRQATTETVTTDACSHCEDRGWIDLRLESTALALRTGEQGDALDRASSRSRLLGFSTMGLVIGGFVSLATVGLGWPAAVIAAGSAAVGGLLTVHRRSSLSASVRQTPLRWSMALPPRTPLGDELRGTLRAADESLTAPLSGRRCIAYEVGLRTDDDAEGEPFTWALLEQRVAASRVGDATIDPTTTHLVVPRQRLGVLSNADLDDASRVWLRQRGFSPVGETLHVFETVIEEGAAVRLREASDGAILRAEASAALTRT